MSATSHLQRPAHGARPHIRTKLRPHIRTRWLPLLGLFPVLILAGLLVPAPAHAHAVLLDSDPGDGAVLDSPPADVTLQFNEPVEPPPEPVRVFDADGEQVDAGDAGHGADHSVLRVSLPPDLPDGVYVVSWRAISADTHPVRGSFVFTVGDPAGVDTGAVTVPGDETDLGWRIAAGTAQWITYAGTLLATGGIVFLVLVARWPGRAPVRVPGGAVAAGLAGTLLGLPLQAVVTSGAGAQALADQELLAGTVASGYGASALVRLAGLTVLFVGLVGLGQVRWAPPVALAGGAAAIGSFLLAGHTVTAEPRLLVGVSNVAHTGAAAVWFGGLVLLALLLRQQRAGGGGAAAGARAVARFSVLAAGCVLVVAAAGTVLGWAEVRSWSALTATGYGWTLLAKLALVAGVVVIGGYNNRRLVPAIRRDTIGTDRAWRRLHRTVRVEAAVILVGVLAVTTVLVVLPPARHHAAGTPAAAAGPYDQVHPLGPEHQVRLVVDPAAVGTNDVTVHLLDSDGEPVALGDEVELRFSLPDADIDRITREPVPADAGEPGVWRHTGPELSINGDWELEVRVLVSDFERLAATAEVPVAAAPEPAGDHDHGHDYDHDHDHHDP